MKKQTKKKPALPAVREKSPPDADRLLSDLRALIEAGRERVAQAVNAGMVLLYWSIGERIRRDILKEKRADYGKKIVGTLSQQLTADYGRGFTVDNLFRMIKLAERFPDQQIVGALSQQLGWSHFLLLIPFDDPLKRDFYAEMCRIERWSVRTLRGRIAGMLFERTALSRKPAELAERELARLRDEDQLTPDLVFRDPYLLDFLRLHDSYSEDDVESAILRELESFLIELGSDFTFVARQKRITIDNRDYYIDLLFYHRRLRRLVVIELKLGAFQAADKGQMELYLRWLEKYEQRPGEEAPIGLILCAGKSADHVELLQLDASGIRIAEYLTELLPRPLLEKTLHDAIKRARARLASQPPEQAPTARPRPGTKKAPRR
jgi:predicted nuclease of restriction endonuclease-like (RecB) superfamily